MSKKNIFLTTQLLCFLIGSHTFAQLTVTPSADPAGLAQNLAGDGVIISKPVLNCSTNGSGFFNGEKSNIGLSSGILLTTGAASIAVGPNNSNTAGVKQAKETEPDPDLLALAGTTVCDDCVLEFDFKPLGDTVTLSYVFASEEYQEFFCLGFNDLFGFFLTGPKPSGGNYKAENLALVPGSTDLVSINNIGPRTCNGINHTELYVDNPPGPKTSVQYDGFTTRLTIKAPVVRCTDYHFKLAIGDVGDSIHDSGVFLEAGSFSSSGFSFFANGQDISATNEYHKYPNEAVKLSVANGDGYTWSWSPNNNSEIKTGSTVTVSETKDVIYTVVGSGAGCTINRHIAVLVDTQLEVTCPPTNPDTLQCLADLPEPDNSLIVVKDSSGNISISSSDVQSGGNGCPSNPIVITRTYTVIDDLQTTDTKDDMRTDCIQTFIIIDNEPPFFNEPPGSLDLLFGCEDEVTLPAQPTIMDPCDPNANIMLVHDTTHLRCHKNYRRIFSYQAEDVCQNLSPIYDVKLEVVDQTYPEWDQDPGVLDVTFSCASDMVILWPTATDYFCDEAPSTIRIADTLVALGACSNQFVNNQFFIAIDNCGNSTPEYYTIKVTVMDDIAPTWDVAPGSFDITFEANEDIVIPAAPTATDNCSEAVTISVDSDVTNEASCGHIQVITYLATDNCGNTSVSFTTTITVNDGTKAGKEEEEVETKSKKGMSFKEWLRQRFKKKNEQSDRN